MKAGAPHPLLSAAFWTAPDERWKPWQQADAPESAKTWASLSSVERLLVPLFSHTNRQGRERESRAHRLDDVNFRSILLILKIFKSGGSVTFASSFI